MDGFRTLFGWVTAHEQLLTGLAAMAALAGLILSPLGHGLRALIGRRRASLTAVAGGGPAPAPPPPMVTDRPSIAVLPFTNISDDRDQEFLADGMTEDVITGLALCRSLFVIARNSTFSYKGKSPNVREVGRELGVRTVLEGSVRRVGENLRVTAQLIDARTGAHIWAQAFDRPLADIFKMQDEITAGIVAALTSHLSHAVTPEVARARPESLEAWELVLRARAHAVGGQDAASLRAAEALLRQAVAKDPSYGVAWAWLAFYISTRWLYEPGRDIATDRAEALACLERGAAIAPGDPEVLAVRGAFFTLIGRPREAVHLLDQATTLNPNEVLYRVMLARALCYSGQPAEALAQMEIVLRLSPRDPYAALFDLDMATIQFALGRHAEAETWARRALAGAPRHAHASFTLAGALAAQGRVDEARQVIRDAVRIAPQSTRASVDYVYSNLGWDEAIRAERRKYLGLAWPPELK